MLLMTKGMRHRYSLGQHFLHTSRVVLDTGSGPSLYICTTSVDEQTGNILSPLAMCHARHAAISCHSCIISQQR